MSLSIRPTDLLFVGATLLWGTKNAFRMHLPEIEASSLRKMGSLVVLTLVGIAFLGNSVDWPIYLRFMQTMFWGILATSFIKSKDRLGRYVRFILLVAGTMSSISVGLYVANPELQRVVGYISYGAGESLDINGGLNEWGALYALAGGILLWHIHQESFTKWHLILLTLIALGLMLDQSRSALLAVGIAIGVIGLLYIHKAHSGNLRRKPLLALLGMALPVCVISVGGNNLAVHRLSDSFVEGTHANESIDDRLYLWSRTADLLAVDPIRLLLGYGNKSFVQRIDSPTSDNFYLDHAASEGFLGLLLILGILTTPVLRLRRRSQLKGPTLLAALALLVALIVSITGNVLVDPTYGGLTFGLVYAISSVYASSEYPVVR